MKLSDDLLFLLVAAILLVVLLALLLPPLWRQYTGHLSDKHQRTANLQVLLGQLAELERERQKGLVAESDFAQVKNDLRRRVLEDTKQPAAPDDSRPWLALALLFLVPALAAGGYVMLETSPALAPLGKAHAGNAAAAEIEGMVSRLAERVQASPDDTEAALMLARSYKQLGKMALAISTYERIEAAIGDDADALADYADLLALQAGGKFEGKPRALILRALSANPGHVQALWLAGTVRHEAADYSGAAAYWQRALAQLPPDSEDARMLSEGIAEAQRLALIKPDVYQMARSSSAPGKR